MSAALSIDGETFSSMAKDLLTVPTMNRPSQRDALVPVKAENTAPQTANSVWSERFRPDTATNEAIVWGYFDSTVGIRNARTLSKDSLRNKISRIFEQIVSEGHEVDPAVAQEIAAALSDVIDTFPLQLNFPYPILLEEGVSLCWDEGDAYAELAFDFAGSVGIYAKNSNFDELLIDMPLNEYRRNVQLIPQGLQDALA